MIDDEQSASLQEELRAVREYFAHYGGLDSEDFSQIIAALMRHCVIGIEPIRRESAITSH